MPFVVATINNIVDNPVKKATKSIADLFPVFIFQQLITNVARRPRLLTYLMAYGHALSIIKINN